MNSMYQIDRLEDGNYDSWNIQMRSVLVHAGLWKVTSGAFKREADTAETWDVLDEKALATITLCVKPSQLSYVKHSKSSKEAWERLKEVYQPTGPVRKVSLYKKLLGLRMVEGDSMSSYLKLFTSATDQLAEVGIELNIELTVIILLSSLPKAYENFVVAIETRDDLPSIDVLKIKLLEEGERRKNMQEQTHARNSSDQQAFIAKASNNSYEHSKEKKKDAKNIVCFKCGQRGHFKANCYTQKYQKNGAKQQQQPRSFTLLAATESSDTFDSSKWCLDSGATAHMCCERSLFTKFEGHFEEIALAGNNFICAEGLGEVKLKNDICELILKDVLYVPNMKGNFMSVSRAVENGCTVVFKKNYAVVKSEGEVILRTPKVHRLFTFQDKRNSCAGAAQINAVTWHNRYGHLNYASLAQLSDKNVGQWH